MMVNAGKYMGNIWEIYMVNDDIMICIYIYMVNDG